MFFVVVKMATLIMACLGFFSSSFNKFESPQMIRMIESQVRMIRMIIVMFRMIILVRMMAFQPHPTPIFGNLPGVPSYWAFPVTGRSHGLAAAARPWPSGAGGEESGADLDQGRTQCHFLRPQRHLAMAWRRHRQATGTPIKWERPVTGNAQ